jgi:hypothetical protein
MIAPPTVIDANEVRKRVLKNRQRIQASASSSNVIVSTATINAAWYCGIRNGSVCRIPPRNPLVDCLDTYFTPQADIRRPVPPATPVTALLDQLPNVGIAVRGRPLIDLLNPVYLTFGRGDQLIEG